MSLHSFSLPAREILSSGLFKVAPGYARDAHLFKLAKGMQELFLLGTIHGGHLTSRSYSLWHLQAAIMHLRPDLLLVESRSEELALGHLGDGPIEMLFAHLYARTLDIPVQGMDWWPKGTGRLRTSSDEREDRMTQNILQQIANDRRVLVLSGFSHVVEFLPRFQVAGYMRIKLPRGEKRKLFDTSQVAPCFPPGMVHYLEQRIVSDESVLHSASAAERSTLVSAIALRQRLLEQAHAIGECAG